jgi:hypothetical protein
VSVVVVLAREPEVITPRVFELQQAESRGLVSLVEEMLVSNSKSDADLLRVSTVASARSSRRRDLDEAKLTPGKLSFFASRPRRVV